MNYFIVENSWKFALNDYELKNITICIISFSNSILKISKMFKYDVFNKLMKPKCENIFVR